MDLLDKVLLEWSSRTEKGYPDLNNEQDLAIFESMFGFNLNEQEDPPISIQDIIKILPAIEEDKEALKHIEKYIKSRPGQSTFFEYLKSKNINDKTLGSGDAPEVVFNVFFKTDTLDSFLSYIKETPITFSSLGTSGNFNSIFSNALPSSTIDKLISVGGSEEGRGVGKGEIFLATVFQDLKMKEGKGDLDWNGKYLEVKGTGARMGKRGAGLTGSTPLLQLFKKHNIPEFTSLSKIIPSLLNFEEKDLVFKELKNTLVSLYDSSSVDQYLKVDTFEDPKVLRKSLQKIYASTYIKREGIDHIIFLDTQGSNNFYSFNEEELMRFIDENPTKFSNPISLKELAPQVFSKGIK